MTNPTINFSQDVLFELFKQSATKFGLNGSAKIYVTDVGGVLDVNHFPPDVITPGGVPKMTAIKAQPIDDLMGKS